MDRRDEVRELRDRIAARASEKAAFSGAVYRDAPIIITANQLRSFTPEPIRAMRALAKEEGTRRLSIAQRFVAEARVLADCDDEFSGFADFQCYFPTFDDMDNDQLRTYLTWRGRVRRGDVRKTSTSYAYVYLYELINRVRDQDERAGWEDLRAFGEAYAAVDPSIMRFVGEWADDYAVYYGLPADMLRVLPERVLDGAREVLLHADGCGDAELFAALEVLSGYRVASSAFYGAHAEDFQSVAARCYRRLATHYEKLSRGYAERLLGARKAVAYQPFARAVFCDPLRRTEYSYRIGPLDTVYCRGGAWSRVRYADAKKTRRQVGDLLKTIDARMRLIGGDPRTLDAPLKAKFLLKIVDEEARAAFERRRDAEARVVRIDMGKLGSIRADADEISDRLIVDEPEDDETNPNICAIMPEKEEQMFVEKQADQQRRHGLSVDEAAFLKVLLAGGSVRDFEREHHAMASILAESVNARLFDEFDDIVIDAAADPPALIDDYRDDVEGMLA